jgi:transposase InsO family protein
MPWRESNVLEERLRFVVLASRKEKAFGEVCGEFGISRPTGYTWLKRYAAGGSSQVADRSRRPLHSPKRTSAETEQAIVELRRRWPDWGAPKLHTMLLREHPEKGPITVRTVHRILERHGLIHVQDRHPAAVQRFERPEPNELWQMDFKGPPGFNKDSAVGPLSVLDDHSRYLPALRQLGSTKTEGVRETLERTFQECGVPKAMLMDHGTPWWNGLSSIGVTELSVWLMRQGIRLLFSGIRHPQTQGKIERMHGALQKAVRKRGTDLLDQGWLDQFRHEYNHIRPHEALGMATPSSRWTPSERPFQSQPAEWDYPASMQVARLAGEGQLCWASRRWDISNALRRQNVGLQQIGDRVIVYFYNTPLRELDLSTGANSLISSKIRQSTAQPDPSP